MTPIRKVASGIDVSGIKSALDAHPELWNARTARTDPEDSPHHGLDDIWARYADMETMQPDGSHKSIWYEEIPGVRPVVDALMHAAGGSQLGGVLITRIKPGQVCKPHVDEGWHARFYDKFAVQIAADPKQSFHFEGHELVTAPGDVFWFDNSHKHWVTNDSDVDRITLIACIRIERSTPCHGE